MGRTTGTGTVTQRETASKVCELTGSSRNSSGRCGKEVLVYDCWEWEPAGDRAGQSSRVEQSNGRWPVRARQNSLAADANWVGRRLR